MKNNQPKISSNFFNVFKKIVLVMLIVINVGRFWIDFEQTINFSGVDLRNRIVGSRLLKIDKDPYFWHWSVGYSTKILDPLDSPLNAVSRVVWPPTVFLITHHVADMDYFYHRYGWFFIQWLLILLSIFLIATTSRPDKKLIVWLMGLTMSASYFWLYHVERGQFYIVYVFLLSLSYYFLNKYCRSPSQSKKKIFLFLTGLVLGMMVSLRFPLGIMIVPFLMDWKKYWRLLVGTVTGFSIPVMISVIAYSFTSWASYFKAMGIFSLLSFNGLKIAENKSFFMISELGTMADNVRLVSTNSSLIYLGNIFLDISINRTVWLFLLVILLAILIFYLYRLNGRKKIQPRQLFLLGSILMIAIDLLLPAPRGLYNDILWLIPLLLLMQLGDRHIRERLIVLAIFIILSIVPNIIFLCLLQIGGGMYIGYLAIRLLKK